MTIKRITTLLLTILMLLLPVLSVSVSAAGDPEMTVTMPQTIEAGKQFAVSVGIKNNPGWSALQFEITYDTQQLELLSVEDGEAMQHRYSIFSFNENPIGTLHAIALYNDTAPTVEESGNMEKDGTWMTMYFTAKSTLANGDSVAVNVNLTTMVNAKLEKQMEPTVAKATAKVGTLSAADNKTQPSKTKGAMVSGVIGTLPEGVDEGIVNGNTNAGAANTTAANGEGAQPDSNTEPASGASFSLSGTVLIVVLAVVVLVAVVVLLVWYSSRRK